MPTTVTFDHKVVAGHHVITSKDMPGLHVTGKTLEEAEAALMESVNAYLKLRGEALKPVTKQMELVAA